MEFTGFGVKNLVFIVMFITAIAFLSQNVKKLISYLKLAKPEERWNDIPARIKQTFTVAIAQSKIFRDPSGGTVHAWIFWGFCVLCIAASNSIFTGFGIKNFYDILGPVSTAFTVLIDVFTMLIMIAVLWAIKRRFFEKVERLQLKGESGEAFFILMMIFSIVTSLLFENAANIALHADAKWAFRPIALLVSLSMSTSTAHIIGEVAFWMHITFIFIFMNYLPFSKHLHVFTSIPNVFLGSLEFPNKLEKIDFEQEGLEKFGVVDFEDFSWKTVLDGYTCTHCGRCTSVCPANITGKVLDPREIIMQVRERVIEKAPILLKLQEGGKITEEEQAILDKKLIGDYEHSEALWQCTTCGACMQECPVMIEHVPAIVGMRRSLVMMESEFPAELQPTFANLENNASPWAFSPAERADWAQGTGVELAMEKPEFEYLFWVGCAGSFDDRAKKVSVAFSQLLQKAGVNFAILGPEEQCNGDIARRAGNEYLADMLIKGNIDTLSRYNVKKVLTICPHCFNTFKNEYPDFGMQVEVIHHTQFLKQLVDEGKLKIKKEGKELFDVAYHDSCYLGRYNSIFDEPRDILNGCGGKINEVERSGDRGLCCGAGGAQMFMEETQGKRVNVERTEELLKTGCKTIAVNCPFCMTMITDGIKAKDVEDVAVKDICEILLDNIAE